jgi:hypothetical protein
MNDSILYDWSMDKMVEVSLKEPDDFLKIMETLTRIGIQSKKDQTLYQSCHILHKRGQYYLVHFKEMFNLDGRESNLTVLDVERRNLITSLLEEWGLLTVLDPVKIQSQAPLSSIKILTHDEVKNWNLVQKYRIGNTK